MTARAYRLPRRAGLPPFALGTEALTIQHLVHKGSCPRIDGLDVDHCDYCSAYVVKWSPVGDGLVLVREARSKKPWMTSEVGARDLGTAALVGLSMVQHLREVGR